MIPRTSTRPRLEELAALASITVDDLKEFKEADVEELTKELGLPVTAKVKLRGLHRKLLEAANADGVARPPCVLAVSHNLDPLRNRDLAH